MDRLGWMIDPRLGRWLVASLALHTVALGRVGDVLVASSAGHRDLDRAAVEAVEQWRFEPARRGTTAVPVWVTLPFRFQLGDR